MWDVGNFGVIASNTLNTARNYTRRNMRYEHYRSRNQTTSDEVAIDFSWVKVIKYLHPEKRFYNVPLNYTAVALQREQTERQVKEHIMNLTEYELNRVHGSLVVQTICTYNNIQGAIRAKDLIVAENGYSELQIRPILTLNPGHNVYVLCKTLDAAEHGEVSIHCILLTSIIDSGLVAKTSAYLIKEYMSANGYEAEETEKLHNAYLSDNLTEIEQIIEENIEVVSQRAEEARIRAEEERRLEREREREREEARRLAKEAEEKLALENLRTDIENKIDSLDIKVRSNKAQAAKESVREAEGVIQRRLSEYRLAVDMKEQMQMRLFQLEMFPGDGEQALKDFLKTMKNILYINLSNDKTKLSIIANTELMYWDDMKFKSVDNDNFRNCVTETEPWKRALLREILLDKTVRVLMTVGFRIDTEYFEVATIKPMETISDFLIQGIPNPHHQYHDCWGNNRDVIQKLLREGKVIETVVQCLTAASSISIMDTTVLQDFIQKQLVTTRMSNKQFLVKDGRQMTVSEYKYNFEHPPVVELPIDTSADVSPLAPEDIVELTVDDDDDDDDDDDADFLEQ